MKKKKEDLTETVKKAPWEIGLSPPNTTVADIISGTWLDDGDKFVFINTNVPGERAGFVTGETPDGDGGLWLSYLGYRAPNRFAFHNTERRRDCFATVIGDTILWDNGTTSRARACVLASNISFMHNGMMGHRPCNFVLLGAKATVFGSIVMAMPFPPFSTETR